LTAKDKLIVALDVETESDALALVAGLSDVVGMFKVGSQLFTSVGPQIVKQIVASDNRVFLDLKFHDIPHQVAGAARAAAQLGVSMFTVHASGGSEMMRRAADAVSEVAERGPSKRAAIVAVSVLTSMDTQALAQIGLTDSPAEIVTRLVTLAEASGVDGVVASPLEVQSIRRQVTNPGFLIVTPGIRPTDVSTTVNAEDQKRISTPRSALAAGASYLVVGRPITGAKDPAAAARAIVAEMENA
jgi:orotidine-5'-phosphate decarboxylase